MWRALWFMGCARMARSWIEALSMRPCSRCPLSQSKHRFQLLLLRLLLLPLGGRRLLGESLRFFH